MNDSVIVYRSKGEKAIDEFMWQNGATVAVGAGFLFAFVVFILAGWAILTKSK